jgi:hypothetical protein
VAQISGSLDISQLPTYVNLDNLGHAGTSGGQNSLDVIAADLGLVADAALDESGGCIGGDLAGDEDLAVGTDSLGLWVVSLVLFFNSNGSYCVQMRGSERGVEMGRT